MRTRHNLVDLGVDGRIILKRILEKEEWEADVWPHVAEDRGQFWTVIGPSGSIKRGKLHG